MSRLLTGARRLRSHAANFGAACRGNVSMVFGLSIIPLIAIVGLGVDYGVAVTDKVKLNNAADAAAIAAVATAKAYIADNPSDGNATANAIAAGYARAYNAFDVNAGSVPFATVQRPVITLTRDKQTFSSTVAYTATTDNHFGQIFGVPVMNIANTVKAAADLPSYLDFYLLVDVSGSMGLPSTQAGLSKLASMNNDMYSDYKQGCQFACHFPGYTGYDLATSNNIQLRSGAVNSAVCSLIQRAASPLVPNQYRIGLYPFINQMATLAPITSNTTSLSSLAQCNSSNPMAFSQLLDTGSTQLTTSGDPTAGTGSGGTHFEVVLPQMQSAITTFDDGSTAVKRRPFVFLVTDGMQNSQHFFVFKNGKYAYPGNPSQYAGYGNAWWDGSQPAAMDPSLCTSLKNAGATISILYIPYLNISFTPNGGVISTENTKVNAFSPTLPNTLKSCASPNFFYTANSPADITAALNAMFNQAIHMARLTQ